MANHKKPTAEELEANIKKAEEEVTKLLEKENEESKTVDETEEDNKEVEESENSDTGDESETQDAQDTKENGEDIKKEEESVDYKEKFVHSTRESQVLHSKNKKINEVIEKAITMPEPTDEELLKEFPDWDIMSDTEKKLARKTYKYDKAFSMLNEVTKESKDADVWHEKVDTYIEDPKTLNDHPELEGKTEDFKLFASKPTRRGVDFEDLIKAFLFDVSTSKPKNKGKMFEAGSGGEKPKPKTDVLSALEGRRLMKTDYKKWKDMLLAGKIANE